MYSIDSPMRVRVPTSVDIGGKGTCNNLMINNRFELIVSDRSATSSLRLSYQQEALAFAPNGSAILNQVLRATGKYSDVVMAISPNGERDRSCN